MRLKLVRTLFTLAVLLYATATASVAFSKTNEVYADPGLVNQDITIEVPGNFPGGFQSQCKTGETINSIQAALSCLSDTVISADAIVTIEILKDDVNDSGNMIDIKHANGSQIHIIGDCQNGQACRLHFNDSGVVVEDHHVLGLLKNVTIIGNNEKARYGILSDHGSSIVLGDKVTVQGFQYGINAFYDSNIRVDHQGSTVQAVNNFSKGFDIETSSSVEIPGAQAENNGTVDFYIISNASVHIDHAIGGTMEVKYNGFVSCDAAQLKSVPVTSFGGQVYPVGCV